MALLLLHYLFFLVLSSPLSSAAAVLLTQLCEPAGGNYTANSAFQSNLNLLLTSLSTSNSPFVTGTKGSIPDRVNGLALCRGDVSLSDCNLCLQNAVQDVQQLCPYYKQAVIWYDTCELRYSNLRFFHTVDSGYKFALYNVQTAKDPNRFNRSVTGLIETVSHQAAYGSGETRFATGRVDFKKQSMPVIYGLAQCTRDVSADECSRCLEESYGYFLECCEGKEGGRVLTASCNFRYEVYSFYEGEPTTRVALPPS